MNARRNARRSALSARGWFLAAGLAILAPLAGGVSACAVTDNEALPPEVPDPADVQTPAGALARYHGALDSLPRLFGLVVRDGNAVPTDELAAVLVGNLSTYAGLDSRLGLAGNQIYNALHQLRAQAREARGVLAAYAPGSPVALQGQLYAAEGYAEVFLADLFCSGIPLSTVDFGADYTLDTARSTKGVYQHAIALFDSALALTGDSLPWQYLAAVGKGRALLALDSAGAAATAVATVPADYQYQVATVAPGGNSVWFWSSYQGHLDHLTMGDHEGLNGLDFRSSGDPRTPAHAVTFADLIGNVYTVYLPDTLRYPRQAEEPATFTLANGVEARLIEAEAALRTGNVAVWLDKLNVLRTNGIADPATTLHDTLGVTGCTATAHCGDDGVTGGTFQLPRGATLASSVELNPMADALRDYCLANSFYAPCSESPAHTTVRVYDVPEQWHAGTGGVAGLPLLEDPGSDAARVDLLFRERAFWLYLTGHRLGDLRRLVRQYNRPPTAVFPSGFYLDGFRQYSQEIVFWVPATEQTYNPKYTGCINHNA